MQRFDRYSFEKYPDVEVTTQLDDNGHMSVNLKGENQEHVQAVAAMLETIPELRGAKKTEKTIS